MFESFLVAGRQSVKANVPLVYGQSITDACLDWESTAPLLERLAEAVRERRHAQVTQDA
jgi:3-deoxy-7-phosphoheptulonate synthase